MRTISAFTLALLSSTSLFIAPSKADASLEELKARLERAQKENLILKTEKVEKENLIIKAEALEAENAAMRNEGKVTKTITSIPSRFEPPKPLSHEQPKIATKQSQDNESLRPRERPETFKAVDKAIALIPKNDERRELVAVSKAAFDPTPVKQWQGIYAGINLGYATGDINSKTTGWNNYSSSSSGLSPTYGVSGQVTNFNGPATGGQVGYNYQTSNNFILGGEIDFQYADVRKTANGGISQSYNYSVSPTSVGTYSLTDRTGLDWYGTLRARLGYSLGSFMPFVSAGFAYGIISQDLFYASANSYGYYYTPTTNYQSIYGNNASGNISKLSIGWTAGTGAEYKVAENWSVKGEYLYTSLSSLYGSFSQAGGQSFGGAGYIAYSSANSGWSQSTVGPFGFHQVRVGLNYHTGWLGSSPTVLAKY